MEMTRDRLADGREIIYFDPSNDQPGAATAQARGTDQNGSHKRRRDERDLPPRAPTGSVRFDEESGEWVALATHRQARTFMPPANECPLCPTIPDNPSDWHSEIPDQYNVAVFENRFPSFGPELGVLPPVGAPGQVYPAYGRCEVITFTSDHHGSFAQVSARQARLVIDAWAERTRELSAMEGIAQVFPFENRGEQIGVTLQHPHGQIYAYPFIPPRSKQMAEQALDHWNATGSHTTLAHALLERELADGARIVQHGKHFTSYVPFAARWPIEIRLVPHRHVNSLDQLDEPEREELAQLLIDLFGRVDALYDEPTPYIASWVQAPLDERYRDSSTLFFQLTSPQRAADKLKYLAGSEAGMGAFINDVAPEDIASRLREATPASTPAHTGETLGNRNKRN